MLTDTKRRVLRYLFWFIALSVMVFIFFSSSQTAEISADTSGGLINVLCEWFVDGFTEMSEAEQTAIIDSFQFVVRKGMHFAIYFTLGFSILSALCTYSIRWWIRFLIAIPWCVIYAASDEYHQTFIDGRSGEVFDLMIDSAGSFAGILLVFICVLVYKALKSRSKVSMRKKQLMIKLSELVATVERQSREIKELKEENRSLKAELERMSSDTESQAEAIENNTCETTEAAPKKPDGFTVKIIDEIDFSETESTDEALSDDMLEYGAGVIGKITIESAKFCEKVSSGGGENQKDMLGLIMGKSEVCKSEILAIAMTDLETEAKKEMIDAQLVEAVEYFKSVCEQGK